jgi:hypothetical protein
MLVAGLVLLVRIRRCSPRASYLGLIGLAGLASEWAFWIVMVHGNSPLFQLPSDAYRAVIFLTHLLSAGSEFLLIWAIVIDRRARKQSAVEADFADPAVCGTHGDCPPPAA